MDARLRRIASDYEQIKKDFTGHSNITVTPIGDEPPQKYHVTYYVNGIYLLEDGRIETLGQHEVEIELHSEYPRYKPLCKILTPIWHPNFRDGQICIGDIWGAGESLSDIIINIGDMIQYKSWNSFSPLSADAAAWAMENKHLFPVGNVNLYMADSASEAANVEIDLFDENGDVQQPEVKKVSLEKVPQDDSATVMLMDQPAEKSVEMNDFDITAEELAGIEYVPSSVRMQGLSTMAGQKNKGKISLMTVLTKGILWALIGALLGFGISEFSHKIVPNSSIASTMGYKHLAKYYKASERLEEYEEKIETMLDAYAKKKGLDRDSDGLADEWMSEATSKEREIVNDWLEAREEAYSKLEDAYEDDFDRDEDDLMDAMEKVSRYSTGVWSAIIALFIGLFLGVGEGVYYGSTENAVKYAGIGAAVSLAIGGISGYIAQGMYSAMISDVSSLFDTSLIRGLGWAIMGIGIGLAIGLIKPEVKRVVSCTIGGAVGAFVGGFVFNYIAKAVPNDTVSRGVGIVVMGILVGVGVGLMEQFAKSAWLKVIRGEFEGKEYLVFPGITSIGNNSKNTIVLFKDKLVSPHHCDIVVQGPKFVLKDCGSPMGTLVNGMRINQHVLRQGDAISIGNSVLIFNTK